MSSVRAIDVSQLPDHAYGSRSVLWWATIGIIAIEGTVFVLAIAAYFYLQGNEPEWPPAGVPNPDLFWPTVNTVVLLLSLFPNEMMKKASEEQNLRRTRIWIVIATLFALTFVVIRGFEYTAINITWDQNAYGSVFWMLLSFHTLHLVTDLLDSLVLGAVVFTHHGENPKRMVDVAENAMYWYFVVLAWIPIYFVLYWSPRWL